MASEMMEKDGMIRLGRTPPEDDTKCASEDQLESHVTKRLSDVANGKLSELKPAAE